MRKFLKMFPAALLVCASVPAFSQVAPAAGPTTSAPPLSVGIAYSNYATDWDGRLSGGTVWADWNFYQAPPLWDGFGIEAEGRELNWGRTGGDPNLREETVAGGVIYTTHFYRRFHPYAKFLVGLGGIYFSPQESDLPHYTHDTRLMYAPSVGADTRFYKSLWLRVNYEYQLWPDFIRHHTMTPNGIDIGVAYDFKAFR
jgi:opacity protein-like surface antigen